MKEDTVVPKKKKNIGRTLNSPYQCVSVIIIPDVDYN